MRQRSKTKKKKKTEKESIERPREREPKLEEQRNGGGREEASRSLEVVWLLLIYGEALKAQIKSETPRGGERRWSQRTQKN